ncbi:MAG: hypothetical protein NTW96_03450, partial [Planctomycetia bacterium]|nr:hypothetical protein [Planctomycetia bacterium]
MNDPMSVKDMAETAYYAAISLAAVVGGGWAVYRYWFHRVYETVLAIRVSVSQHPLGAKNLVFLQVTLANKGKRRIVAKRVKADHLAYADKEEKLRYSCSLQVKRVLDTLVAQDTYLDWFRSDKLQPLAEMPSEINLLDLYVEPESGEVSEWLVLQHHFAIGGFRGLRHTGGMVNRTGRFGVSWKSFGGLYHGYGRTAR